MIEQDYSEASEELHSKPAAGAVVSVWQEGGAIGLVDGVPINPLGVKEAVAASLAAVGESVPWLVVLAHSAAKIGSPGKLEVLCEWSADQPGADAEKYEAYVSCLREQIAGLFPYLPAMFDAASALVQATPGSFAFCTPVYTGIAFRAPQLDQFTYMTPFPAGPGDVLN